MRLKGKVAVIVGGTSGIGARTAQLFVAEGARVTIAGRRVALGEQVAASLGPAARFVRTDARDDAAVRELVEDTAERFGRIDCLFNNAGALTRDRSIAEIDLSELDSAFAVHVKSIVVAMQAAMPFMIRQGAGSVINMASSAGIQAGVAGPVYSTVKAAVRHLTRCAAVELGEDGVRVNSISPGPIATEIFFSEDSGEMGAAERRIEAVATTFDQFRAQVQPIPRMGTTEDVARAALFMASDEASLVNGHDLVIDGGSLAGRPASFARAHWTHWATLESRAG